MLDALFSLGQAFEGTGGAPPRAAGAEAEGDRMLLALFRMAADGGHLGGAEAAQAAMAAQASAAAPPRTPEHRTSEAREAGPEPAIDPAIVAELYRVKLEGVAEAVDGIRWGWAWRWKKQVASFVRPTLTQAIDLLHAGLGQEVGPLLEDRATEARHRGNAALAGVLATLHRRHDDPAWNPMHPAAQRGAIEGEAFERLKFSGRMEGYAVGIRAVCGHAPWRGWFLRTRPQTALVLDQVAERVRDANVGAAARLLEERRKSTPEVSGAFAQLVESPIYAAYAQSIAIGAGHE